MQRTSTSRNNVFHMNRFGAVLVTAIWACASTAGGSNIQGGASHVSFCITDGASSNVFYLTDLTSPLPGQSVSEEQYTQGRLVLGGSFLPNPKLVFSSADRKNNKEVELDWGQMAHRRAAEYSALVARVSQQMPMDSSTFLSVVPIGLAGATSNNDKTLSPVVMAEHDATEAGSVLSWFFSRPPVPRLWPMISAALRNAGAPGDGGGDGRRDDVERVAVWSVARFVVSLLRYRVEVIGEEDHYVQSLALQRHRRKARDPNPDLREGQLRADLPQAYVSHVDYGHKLVVTANITVWVEPHNPPPQLDHLAHHVMRVVARDLSAAAFDAMYPSVSMFVRFRWDPDLAPPLAAVRALEALKLQRYGAGEAAGFNATLHSCPRGSFRRSKHLPPSGAQPTCPSSAEFPSVRDAAASWVMRGGGARQLQERVEDWRAAMQGSAEVAGSAVPLSLQVRRAPTAADAAVMEEELSGSANASQEASAEAEGGGGGAGGGAGAGAKAGESRFLKHVRARLREKAVVSWAGTTCMQSTAVPLPLMLALGDLMVFLCLMVLLIFCGWLYLLSGYLVARLAEHVRLPPFISVSPVPFRVHLLTFGGGGGTGQGAFSPD